MKTKKTKIIHGHKINKITIQGVREIVQKGGAVIVSHWTNGSGKFTTRRPIPAFCDTIGLWRGNADFMVEHYEFKGYTAKAVRALMKKHPRASEAVICTDIRGARKAIKIMDNPPAEKQK